MKEKTKIILSQKQKKILFSVLAVFIAVSMFFAGFFIRPLFYDKASQEALEIIKLTKEHYDGEYEISDSDYGRAIVNYLLDNYSFYYTEEEHKAIVDASKGKNLGIGVSFLSTENEPIIYSVEGNSPAEKVGMMAGEKLISGSFEGKTTEFKSKKEALDFLSDREEYDIMTLKTLLSDGVTEKTYTVAKQRYNKNFVTYYDSEYKYSFYKTYEETEWHEKRSINDSVDGYKELDGDTALISFSSFEGELDVQLNLAFKIMKERGKTKLILDLRGNIGGYMKVFCNVAPYFIDFNGEKSVLAIAKYKNGKTEKFYSNGDKFNKDITSISVIANPMTASAAECLIGAMLYYKSNFDISKLVIQKNSNGKSTTYGKGIMQEEHSLSTGSVIKLTVAHLYQPDGETCIHGKGLVSNANNVADSNINAVKRAVEVLN